MILRKMWPLALVMIFTGSTINAQSLKFGHIDIQSVINEMPEYKNIQTVLDAEISKLESQFTTMREELTRMENDYRQKAATLTPAERQARETELADMQGKAEAFFRNAQQSIQQRNQEMQAPVMDKLNRAIDAVGSEGGFMYIFEVNSGLTLYYSSQSIDVTLPVKAKLGIK